MPMIRLAVILALVCGPAMADVTVTIVPPDADGYVGQIVHHNQLTQWTAKEQFLEFETEHGTFIIRLSSTTNYLCTPACPDTIEIWDWPEDIIPDAMEATTQERGVSIINLYEYWGA